MIICAAAMVYWFAIENFDDGEENQDTTAHFLIKPNLNKIQGYTLIIYNRSSYIFSKIHLIKM
jgi:hypothetical protein